MRLPVALFAIVLGALEVAGGMQELIYRGIMRSETDPLIAGTLGTVAGAIVLAAGIALLMRSDHTSELALAAALISFPVFVLIGVFQHYAGWGITALGLTFPILFAIFCRRVPRSREA